MGRRRLRVHGHVANYAGDPKTTQPVRLKSNSLALTPSNPSCCSFESTVFQQLELDYVSGPPNKRFYNTTLKEVPIIRAFGVTDQGERL